MENLTLESNITLKQAYLIMYEYLDQYWESRNKPSEIGDILGELSLWNSEEGKRPMNSSIFPKWITCATKVLIACETNEGYRNADISFE